MSDYNNWPKLFPSDHNSVRLIAKETDVDYIELGGNRYGKITERHKVIPSNRIYIWEITKNWDGLFVNIFESTSDGRTKLTLKVGIYGKNFVFKVISPFSKGYVRRRVRKGIFEELKEQQTFFLKFHFTFGSLCYVLTCRAL